MKVKIGFYLLSMVIFLVIVIILGIDFPVYFGNNNWEFVGWDIFLTIGVLVPLVCSFLILCAFAFVFYFHFRMIGSATGPVDVVKADNISSDNMSFVASFFFPIVSFAIGTTWRHVLVLSLLFVVLGIIYIQSDIYYCNPSLCLFGFRTYKIIGDYNGTRMDKVFIVRGKLKVGDTFCYVRIDDNTYYAIKNE